jgi:hypothetical protein
MPGETAPFELPEAQQASVIAQSGSRVAVTLYCLVPRRDGGDTQGTEPAPVRVQMTSALAVQLAEQLLRAAAKSG